MHIAYAPVISGANANLGVDSRRGIEIAVDDKNGNLLGHPFQLTGVDTLCNPEGGQAAAATLAADQTVVGIIGPSCSSEAAGAAPILSDAGFTLISPSATAPGLTHPSAHAAGFFRMAHNDAVQGAVAAEVAYNTLGVRTAATIKDGSNYTASTAKVFATRFHELGGQVVGELSVKPDDTDMGLVIKALMAANPDVIYYKVAVQDPDGTLRIGRQALRDAVLNTKGFQGLTGTLTCNQTITGRKNPGDCGDPHIAVYQILNSDPASCNPGTAANANPMKIYP